MEKIISYIREKYAPVSILVYGSFSDGSNNEHSDFDAVVISSNHARCHDDAFVDGVQLDVFVYPISWLESEKWEPADFIQLMDSKVVYDTNEYGASLKQQVTAYVQSISCKEKEEIRTEVEWCKKMLLRTRRNDAEGMFRWHWLLIESLEIFCDAVGHPYFGPKKSLRWMERQYPEAYTCYKNALFRFETAALESWIDYLEQCINSQG